MQITEYLKYYHYIKDSTYAFSGHRHAGGEANVVLSGCLEVTCGERVFRLHGGEMAVWDAAIFHRNRVLDGATEFLSIHFHADAPPALSVSTLSSGDAALVSVLEEESLHGVTPAGRAILEALLLRREAHTREPVAVPTGASALYREAVRVMEEHVCEPLDVREIARLCGVCLTTLKNAFAACAGKGVKAYFLELKMERARGLIAGGMPISEAAATLGFSSAAYFSQCFRRLHGMSAAEWRRGIADEA